MARSDKSGRAFSSFAAIAVLRGGQVAPALIDADDVVVGVRLSARNHGIGACWRLNIDHLEFSNLLPVHGSFTGLGPADCGYPCQKPEASSARRETTLQREIAVKNVSLGIFDPSLGIFDPARCRRNPDFWGGFPPKPRAVLRNRLGIPRLSGVSSRAHEAGMRDGLGCRRGGAALLRQLSAPAAERFQDQERAQPRTRLADRV